MDRARQNNSVMKPRFAKTKIVCFLLCVDVQTFEIHATIHITTKMKNLVRDFGVEENLPTRDK